MGKNKNLFQKKSAEQKGEIGSPSPLYLSLFLCDLVGSTLVNVVMLLLLLILLQLLLLLLLLPPGA